MRVRIQAGQEPRAQVGTHKGQGGVWTSVLRGVKLAKEVRREYANDGKYHPWLHTNRPRSCGKGSR